MPRQPIKVIPLVHNTLFRSSQKDLRGNPVQSHGAIIIFFLLTLFFVLAYFHFQNFSLDAQKWRNWEALTSLRSNNTVEASVAPTNEATEDFEYVFNMPRDRDTIQWDNYGVLDTYLKNPEGSPLTEMGFPAIYFTANEAELARALAWTESRYYHFAPFYDPESVLDSEGNALYTSPVAHCVGFFQGCNQSVCPQELWEKLESNIWCGLKLLRENLDRYPGDHYRAIAAYKGAFLMKDTDGDGYKDMVVFGDDGKEIFDPSLFNQVQSPFNLLTVI